MLGFSPKSLNGFEADLRSGDLSWPDDHLLKIEKDRYIGNQFSEPRITSPYVSWVMSIYLN